MEIRKPHGARVPLWSHISHIENVQQTDEAAEFLERFLKRLHWTLSNFGNLVTPAFLDGRNRRWDTLGESASRQDLVLFLAE